MSFLVTDHILITQTFIRGEYKIMSKSLRRCFIALCLAAVMLLTACGNSSDSSRDAFYSDGQIMVVLATERNRYRELYTDRIWSIVVDDAGTTFETYLLGEIKNFMCELKTMNLLADQEDIRLSGQEKEQMEQLAKDYYATLTPEDRKYIKASEKEITDLYQQYDRANKLVDELTKDVNLEISDSDAKIIRVQEIALDDEDIANRLLAIAEANILDFATLAETYTSLDEVERSIGRGETGPAYEDAVFSLDAGELSGVFEEDGYYWIVKVIDDYDEEATQERKEKLMLQRKDQAFDEIYEAFAAENTIEADGKIWSTKTMEDGQDSTTTSFFTMYHEFKEQ